MARLVQNSFVAGEIAPELYGRTDLATYYQSAQEISNFVVRKTGGIQKRAGTDLLWHLNVGATSYRAFPFFYDRTHYAVVFFYTKENSNTLFYRVLIPNRDQEAPEQSTTITQVKSIDELSQFRIKQIGDTIFFSRRGARLFSGKLDYDEATIKWESMLDEIDVADAPNYTAKTSGFETNKDEGYLPSDREYALLGVKSGVFSELKKKTVTIYYPWVAGAKVTLSFTPNWAKHDYYVLAMKQGGYYGVLANFYPNTKNSDYNDSTWAGDGNGYITSGSVTIGDVTYKVGTSTKTAWAIEPNAEENVSTATTDEKAKHKSAIAVNQNSINVTYKVKSAPILGLKMFFGAKLVSTDGTRVDTIGTTGNTNITLYSVDSSNKEKEIATWTKLNATYSEAGQTLQIANPVTNSTGIYKVKITNDSNEFVIVRGITLLSDSATQTFVDNNIQAGDVTGIQEPLLVGDSGMDIGLVDIWEQRLVLASSTNLPFTLWFSTVGDVKNFYSNRPQTMDDAFSVTIPAVTSTKILHMATTRWFLLFTESGEYVVDNGGNSGFGYSSITIKKTSAVGSHESIEPVITEDKIVFISSDARKLYDLAYSLEQDVIIPSCQSDLVPHLTENKSIKKIVYQQHPDPVIWCLMEDGSLLSMTYLPAHKIYAWARHNIGCDELKLVDILAPSTLSEQKDKYSSSEVILVFENASRGGDVYIERMRAQVAVDNPKIDDSICADHCGYTEADYPNGVNPQTPVVARVITTPMQLGTDNTLGLEKNVFDTCLNVRRSGQLEVRPYTMWGKEPLHQAQSLLPRESDLPPVSDGEVALFTGAIKILPRAYINSRGQMEISSSDDKPCEIMAFLYNITLGVDEEQASEKGRN